MEMWRKWNWSLELGREVRAIDVDLKVVKYRYHLKLQNWIRIPSQSIGKRRPRTEPWGL